MNEAEARRFRALVWLREKEEEGNPHAAEVAMLVDELRCEVERLREGGSKQKAVGGLPIREAVLHG